MTSTVIASIVGAFATIVAAVISPTIANSIKTRKANEFIPSASNDRGDSLYGNWVGEFDQKVGAEYVIGSHSLSLVFYKGTQLITGMATIGLSPSVSEHFNGATSFELKLINTIFDGRILKTDFVNKNNKVIHLGTIYGELSPSGQEINGHFLGFGLISNQFVSGTITLKKD